MLIKTKYLNGDDLSSYIASAEGGLRESIASRASHGRKVGASVGVGHFASADAGKETGAEDLTTFRDTDSSRLQRLIEVGRDNPDQMGWVEVTQPENDFKNIGVGAMIDWECETYISEFSAIMSMHNQFDQFSQLMEPAKKLGFDLDGLPSQEDFANMSAMLKALSPGIVVIGEDEESDWKVAGHLDHKWALPDVEFDGFTRIIAKVRRRVDKGQQQSIFNLPGSMVDRKRRREMDKRLRESPIEGSVIEGPALMVDYLAIYT